MKSLIVSNHSSPKNKVSIILLSANLVSPFIFCLGDSQLVIECPHLHHISFLQKYSMEKYQIICPLNSKTTSQYSVQVKHFDLLNLFFVS